MADQRQSAYVSEIRIEREEGPNRLAHMPAGEEPVEFGVHGAIARHYGMGPEEFGERDTTIDYVIAAAAG